MRTVREWSPKVPTAPRVVQRIVATAVTTVFLLSIASPPTVAHRLQSSIAPPGGQHGGSTIALGDDNALSDDAVGVSRVLQDSIADMEIVTQAFPNVMSAGDWFHYVVAVRNLGPEIAERITVVDEFPIGMPEPIILSSSPATCEMSEPIFTRPSWLLVCTIESMPTMSDDPANGRVSIQLRVMAPPLEACSTFTNRTSVSVESPEEPAELLHNNRSESIATIGCADLELRAHSEPLAAGATYWRHGDEFDYTIIADNLGPHEARRVQVTGLLPDGFESIETTAIGGLCNVLTIGSRDFVACEWDRLDADAAIAMIIRVRVAAPACGDAMFTPTVRADDGYPDPDYFNNSDTDRVLVGECTPPPSTPVPELPTVQADLWIEKSVSKSQATMGDVVQYHIKIGNNGPAPSVGAVLFDDVPVGVAAVEGSISATEDLSCEFRDGSPPIASSFLRCDSTDAVEPGEIETVTFDATILPPLDPPSAIVRNYADVLAFETFDPDRTNNLESAEVEVYMSWLLIPIAYATR